MPPTFAPREHVEVRARKLNQLARDVSSSGDAAEHAADAQAALTAAQAAALAAATARVGSEAARDGSTAAQAAANLAVTAAGIAKDAAITAANDSATHADTAFGHATAAEGSASIAAVHATEAGVAVISATAQANLATLKANEADTLAQSAALTATSASVSADESATSASAAATSELNASVSSAAAGTSATAAATSATTAAAAQTAASNSATSASNSANTAAVQAANAATSASAAATSATSASASQSAAGASATSASNSANTATVQAGNAASSASAASSSAANASTSAASASQSALLSATVGSRAFNGNPDFGTWSNPAAAPEQWSAWVDSGSSLGTITREAGFSSRYAVRHAIAAGNGAGIAQYGLPKVSAGYSVLEWSVELVSGDFSGAGLYVYGTDGSVGLASAGSVDFWALYGAGTTGKVYSGSQLVQLTHPSTIQGIMHLMAGWSGYGRTITAKTIRWLRAVWRPATEAEIRDQTVLTPLSASVATNSLAIADVQGRTEAYWEVIAVAGGRAKLRVFADANSGGGVDIEGDTRISGSLLVGGTITASKFLTDAGVDLAAIVPGSLNWKLNSGAPTAYSGNYWNGTSYDPHINTGVINGTGASAISTTHLCRITAQFSSSGATGFGGTTYNVILTVYYRINGGAWTSTGVTASDTRVGGGYTTKTATGTFAAPSAGTIEFAYGITSSATAGLGVTVIDHSIAIEATFWK